MLKETRLALRITSTAYDAELAQLIMAAAGDLTHSAGVPVEGVSLTVTWNQGTATVTDSSSITDDLLIRAIITYVRMRFGSPEDYDRLKAAYDEQKAQLQTATGYGIPDDESEDDTE